MNILISVALLTFAGLFQEGECQPNAWSAPSAITPVDGGSATFASTIDDGATTAALTVTATTTDVGGISGYTMTQTPATGATFGIDGSGAVTISSGTVSYSTAPVYTFVVTATDANGAVSASVTLSVNDKPAFGATQYGVTIPDGSAAGTTLTTLSATDVVNSGTLTYTLPTGNTNTDFAVSTAGVITTANVMAASTLGGYSLQLEAADATLTGTTTVWVVVTSCSGAAAGIVASIMTLLMAMTAALY